MAHPARINRSIVAITGGYLREPVHSSWIVEPETIGEEEYITLDKADARMMSFLGGDASVVEYFAECRNNAVAAAMMAIKSDDALADSLSPDSKRQKSDAR